MWGGEVGGFVMADDGLMQSFHEINCTSSPSLLTDSTMASPTSILDFKPFSPVKNPRIPCPESRSLWVTRRVSLGLLEALIDDTNVLNHGAPPKVLFGSQLKIHVPSLSVPLPLVLSPGESPKSPSDFGIKTRSPRVGSLPSASPFKKHALDCLNSSLSAAEIELSEDYTCVISYAGPSPETTHIVDDCVVGRCCGVVKFSESRKKNLLQGRDAHLCRSSSECSCKEMVVEEEKQQDDIFSSCS